MYAATRGDVVDEETPFDLTAERHIYASSKLAAEMFCADYANLFGRPYTVLRYGIPFGPRMRSDLVVAAFLERALRGEALRIDGDGAQERSFVYVEDLAAAHVLALAPVAQNRTYNLEANALKYPLLFAAEWADDQYKVVRFKPEVLKSGTFESASE